jgi:hypothetical protein
MHQQKRTKFHVITFVFALSLGILLILVSTLYASSFMAILGTAIVFWGTILFYILPVKHFPLTFVAASASCNVNNIERILSEFDLSEKGVYLPPKNLKNMESSLIFIPKVSKTALPTSDDFIEKLYSPQKDGAFLTPPGLAFSILFEKELGISFTKTTLEHLELTLPKLLTEDLQICESVDIQVQGNMLTIEIIGSIFNDVCKATNSQPHTHEQVGCLLSSALACILAKTTGKPITIQSETQNLDSKKTIILFRIEDK